MKNDLVGKKNVIRMRKQQLYYRLCILFIPCYIIRKIIITVLHTNMISWIYGNMAINGIVVLCANTMCILRDNYIIGNIVTLHLKCYFLKQIKTIFSISNLLFNLVYYYFTFEMLFFKTKIQCWWVSVELKDHKFSGYWWIKTMFSISNLLFNLVYYLRIFIDLYH